MEKIERICGGVGLAQSIEFEEGLLECFCCITSKKGRANCVCVSEYGKLCVKYVYEMCEPIWWVFYSQK